MCVDFLLHYFISIIITACFYDLHMQVYLHTWLRPRICTTIFAVADSKKGERKGKKRKKHFLGKGTHSGIAFIQTKLNLCMSNFYRCCSGGSARGIQYFWLDCFSCDWLKLADDSWICGLRSVWSWVGCVGLVCHAGRCL